MNQTTYKGLLTGATTTKMPVKPAPRDAAQAADFDDNDDIPVDLPDYWEN